MIFNDLAECHFLIVIHSEESYSMYCSNVLELLKNFSVALYGEKCTAKQFESIRERLEELDNWTVGFDSFPFSFSHRFDDNRIFQIYRVTH